MKRHFLTNINVSTVPIFSEFYTLFNTAVLTLQIYKLIKIHLLAFNNKMVQNSP